MDKDDRKRPHLRLVVNNAEKRSSYSPRGQDILLPLKDLVAMRDEVRPLFYEGLDGRFRKGFEAIERFLAANGWPYGFDPQHGPIMVLPAEAVCPEAGQQDGHQDEIILYLTEDATGTGLCLSLEMILPFYSEDEAIMEDALLFAPVFQYGTLFLEENQQDQGLDLIYRLGLPIYPPALTRRLLQRFTAIAAVELREILQTLAEYPEDM